MPRRRFLGAMGRAAGAAAAFAILPRRVLGGPGYAPPSEELTKAVIGAGSQGKGHIKRGGIKTVAVCDVDEKHLAEGLRLAGPGAKAYKDFREVLERPDIDIIDIATPPHWHALISIAAAEAGKDIWCEKPMTRTIGEGRKVVEAVERYGRIFRINTWFRFQSSFYGFGTTVEAIKKLVASGMLGWPLKVTIGAATGFNWKSRWTGRTDLAPEPAPPELDYDMWLGPAPYKPYNALRVHRAFRGYWDYDGGGLGDMGQHYLDPVQYFLGKDGEGPVEIEADAPQQHPDAVGPWRCIRLRYADGCEIVLDGEDRDKDAPYIEGPEGKLFRTFESTIPNLMEKMAAFPDPEPQETDFAEAVRSRRKFALNEANGHRSCSLVNLSKIAVRLGRGLRYDPKAERFIDDDAANRLIDEPMRAPWHL